MNSNNYQGFTLIELMITIAIISLLSAIAIPSYNGYIETSQMATAKQNAVTLAGFEDTYFYENDTFLAGTYIPGGANGLTQLDWVPSADDDQFSYVVSMGTCGNIRKCYTITVTNVNNPVITQTISRP